MPDFRAFLWLSENAWRSMNSLATEMYPLETGGMLIGYEADNGEAVVTTVIGPGPKGEHRRWKFVPDHNYQQDQLEIIFRKSDGLLTYLGDWHTHPNGTCDLSRIDKKTLDRIARTAASGTRNPIMTILCGRQLTWNIGAVRYLGAKRHILYTTYDVLPLSVVATNRVI